MQRGPHWLLADPDAKQYGAALANALRHLPLSTTQKTMDFAALAMAIFAHEGPRVMMDIQLSRQRRQPQQPGPARVFQFRPTQGPPPPPQPQQPAPPFSDVTYEPEGIPAE